MRVFFLLNCCYDAELKLSFILFVACVTLTEQGCLQKPVRNMAFFRQLKKRTVSFTSLLFIAQYSFGVKLDKRY